MLLGRTSAQFFTISWPLIVVVMSMRCFAGLSGDPKYLEMAAVKYQANLEKLQTWKGQVKFAKQNVSIDSSGRNEVRDESTIEFAYDQKSGNYRFDIDAFKLANVVEGVEIQRVEPERRTGIIRDGLYFELTYKTRNPNSDRRAHVRAEKSSLPGFHDFTFEPVFFLTDQGTRLDAMWKALHDNVDNEKLTGSIERNGNNIILTQSFPASGTTAIQTADLSVGGNYSEILTTVSQNNDNSTFVCKWEWQQINDVWVPKRFSWTRSAAAGSRKSDDSLTWEWVSNIVNQPLAADEFELPRLGLRRGDRLQDFRTGETSVVEGAEFPTASPADVSARNFPNALLVGANIAIIAILLGFIFYQRTVKRSRDATQH